MKKLKKISLNEIDKLTKEESKNLVGGFPISYGGGGNSISTDISYQPIDITGISVGRTF